MECISYKKGYKYQLVEAYTVKISIRPKKSVASPSEFIVLTADGLLTINKGYAWMAHLAQQLILVILCEAHSCMMRYIN